MNQNFEKYAEYYDLIYSQKDYSKESKYILSIIEKFFKDKPLHQIDILELGCGSGGHAKYLSSGVNGIIGIEKSKQMLKLALQKKTPNFIPVEGDITQIDQVLTKNNIKKKFQATIALFHVINYLNSNDDILRCFSLVNKNLDANGLFIFDSWFTPAVYWQKPEKRLRNWENDMMKITRISEPVIDVKKNIVIVDFTVNIKNKNNNEEYSLKEKHPMRPFTVPEIELFAKCSGFKVESVEEFLTGNNPSLNTWGVCFVLKKT
jgi:SAM-dependent methyltransferase